MILLYTYFLVNLFLTLKIVYNLNTKFKDDKDAWDGVGFYLAMTMLFGCVLWVKSALAKS